MQYIDFTDIVRGGVESDIQFSGQSVLSIDSRNLVEHPEADKAVDEFLSKFSAKSIKASSSEETKTKKKSVKGKPKKKSVKGKPKKKKGGKEKGEKEKGEEESIVVDISNPSESVVVDTAKKNSSLKEIEELMSKYEDKIL